MELTLIILLILLTTKSEGGFYVSNSSCKLGLPTLRYDGNEIVADLSEFGIDVNGPFRVGYFRGMIGLEYTGCAHDSQVNSTFLSPISAEKDPGSCFHFCRNDIYFGIKDSKCFCLPAYNSSSLFIRSGCTKDCNTKGIACGSGNHYISIYRINTNVTTASLASDTRCLRFEPFGKNSSWTKCAEDRSYVSSCYKENTVYPLISNSETMMQAADKCFENSSRPTTYSNLEKTVHSGGPLWTGVLCNEAIFNVSDQVQDMLQGVLQKHRNNYKLQFQFNIDNVTDFLCYKENDMPTPTEGINHTTFESSIKSGTSTTSTVLSTVTSAMKPITASQTNYTGIATNTLATETSIPKTTNRPNLPDRKNNSGVGLPVGVSVAAVVILVVVVAVLVVIRRRKLKTPNRNKEMKKSTQGKDETNDYSDIPDIIGAKGNSPLCNFKIEGQDNYAHTYHVLEKDQTKEGKINTSSETDPQTESHYNYPDMTDFLQVKVNNPPTGIEDGQYAHTYFVLEEHQKVMDCDDGTYNVTRSHKPKTVQETDNVYNRLDDNNDANYDHIPGSASKKKASDNVYDSKENATSVLKPGEEPDSVYNQDSNVGEYDTCDHFKNKAFEPN